MKNLNLRETGERNLLERASAFGTMKKTMLLFLTASVIFAGCKKGAEDSTPQADVVAVSEAGDNDSKLGASVSATPTGPATLAVYPVRGAHNTGYDAATQCAQSSWNCDRLYSNSDFVGGDHYGIDTWAALNTPIAADVTGVVTFKGFDSGLGNTIVIREPSGWHHWLGHMNSLASGTPGVGSTITAGTIVGYLGHTGSNSGGVNHLHESINYGSGFWSTGQNFHGILYAKELAVCGPVQPPAPPIESCDYNGDGKSEQTFFNNGVWKVYGSSDVTNGIAGDIAVPGDYNGDGLTDKVVYRPSTGYWYNVPGSAGGISWGQANTDIPVPGDYDGNGSTEIVVFRPSTGQWINYTGGYNLVWGQAGDIPVPGDYDGAGITDMCVYRPSNFTWYVRTNYPATNGSLIPAVTWGQAGDIPVPGDYNGDNKTDMTVYRPSTGQWFPSTNVTSGGSLPGFPIVFGGTAGDIPAPGDYVGDGKTDLSYYRAGIWYINGGTNVVFGNVPGGDKLVNLPWSIRKFYFP